MVDPGRGVREPSLRPASETEGQARRREDGRGAAIGLARLSPRRFRRRGGGRNRARTDRRQRRQQGGEYGTYLETDSERKREIFLQSAARAEALQAAAPDFVNAYYFHAQALGRYSQEISVVKALAQGIGGRVMASLDKAIRLEPNHADAHIALGSYHAEVVSKVGAMLAKTHLRGKQGGGAQAFRPRTQAPARLAIARIEEANGLVMLFGKAKLAEAEKLYEEAARCKPADAMQKLDAEHAREEAEG